MTKTTRLGRMLALALLAVSATVAGEPARSADLAPVAGGPGTVFIYGDVVRRGIAVSNGTLLFRRDGCWVAQVPMANTTAHDRHVTVIFRWTDGRGRVLAEVVAVARAELPAGGATTFVTEGCDGAIARAYGILATRQAARIITSR